MSIDQLTKEWANFCRAADLPNLSADEFEVEYGKRLSGDQRAYVANFINRWDREQLIEAHIVKAKQQIREDVACGLLPPDVGSFAELHDYVDANLYGLDDPADEAYWDKAGEFLSESVNAIQDAVDAWIKTGALKSA